MKIFPKTGSRSGFEYSYEHVFSPRVTLVPGSKVKIKGERGWFTFVAIATNPAINSTWVDVMDKDWRFRSFRVDRIKGVPPKRRNKVVYHDER
jgi:hypothetical protein